MKIVVKVTGSDVMILSHPGCTFSQVEQYHRRTAQRNGTIIEGQRGGAPWRLIGSFKHTKKTTQARNPTHAQGRVQERCAKKHSAHLSSTSEVGQFYLRKIKGKKQRNYWYRKHLCGTVQQVPWWFCPLLEPTLAHYRNQSLLQSAARLLMRWYVLELCNLSQGCSRTNIKKVSRITVLKWLKSYICWPRCRIPCSSLMRFSCWESVTWWLIVLVLFTSLFPWKLHWLIKNGYFSW